MKLHEYQAQRILMRYGVPVPAGDLATSVDQVRQIAERLDRRVVIRAQVLTGGRGRAGGIRLAGNAAEAERLAGQILGMSIQGYTVSKVLVNEAVEIEREVYLGIALDRELAQPVILASAEGNVEIAEVARDTPERVWRKPIDPLLGLRVYQARELAYDIGLEPEQVSSFVSIAMALYRALVDHDAFLVEVNPLVICPGSHMVSLDARMVVDDNALFRHPDLVTMRDETQETEAERLARRYSLNYVGLNGDVGCLANGAGLAMATMDLLRAHGLRPSCFVDLGSGATKERARMALHLALSSRPRALLANVFGGIAPCEAIAQGILAACQELSLAVPLVVRFAGWNAQEGRRLLSRPGVTLVDSTFDAVRQVVDLIGEMGPVRPQLLSEGAQIP